MSAVEKILKTFFRTLDRLATFVSTASLILLVGMVTVQVVLRFAKMPLFGIEETELFPIMWLYGAGALIAAYDRTHISCGLAGVVFKDPFKIAVADCVRDALTIVCAVIGLYIVYPHFTYITSITKTTVSLRLPTVFAECSFIIALAIMVLYAIRDFLVSVKTVRDIKKGAEA